MRTGSFRINQLLRKAKVGQFKLPQFQRNFVWNEAQVALLIDSIARNYPIGSLLLLEPGPEIQLSTRPLDAELDTTSEKCLEDDEVSTDAQELLILDGQILSDDQYEVFLQERGKFILKKIKEVVGPRFSDDPLEE